MAGRGRPPKPTASKRLARNPGKRPLPKKSEELEFERVTAETYGAPPKWMDAMAREIWKELSEQLVAQDLFTIVDRSALEIFCTTYSRWRKAEKAILKADELTFTTPNGYRQELPEVAISRKAAADIRAWCSEFGFTPSARSRLVKGSGAAAGKKKPSLPAKKGSFSDEEIFGTARA